MSLSNNFPAIAPSLNLDFANVKALDPRISFTRTTTATYYDGVTTAKAEENLFLYSQEFDNGTGWAAQRASVNANSTTAPDGTSTADSLIEDNTASDTHRIIENLSGNVSVTGSKEYVFSVFAKANTRDWIAISPSNPGVNNYLTYFDLTNGVVGTSAGGNTGSIESVGNGWYRCIVKRTTASNQTQIDAQIYLATGDGTSSYTGDGTSGVYLWGAQLEQRSAVSSYTPTTTQPITNYIPVLQTAASGVARFDHNPTTGESLGLLVEEQRTNLVTYSEQFDNAAWAKTRTSITSNTIVAPDGTLTGDKLIATSVSGNHSLAQSVSVTAQAYTFTCYAKAGEYDFIQLNTPDPGDGGAGKVASFNLATGELGGVQDAGVSRTITSVGNGWYRCSTTFTMTGSGSSQISIFSTNTDVRAESFTGNGFDGIYIWGAQLEAGAFSSSYISTVASQVTRSVDFANIISNRFTDFYRADEGTVYFESQTIQGTNAYPFSLFGSSTANRISVNYSSLSRISGIVRTNNDFVAVAATAENTAPLNTFGKGALAYKVNDFGFSWEGGAPLTDTSLTLPVVEKLDIGNNGGLGNNYLNGTIKKIAFYPSRLPDAQLQALTS